MRWIAIAVVLVGCKRAPDEAPAPPPSTRVVPLAGEDTFDPARTPACLVATVRELREHPHWTIRLDDLRSFEHNIDAPPHLDGWLERDVDGARWHDGAFPKAVIALDATAAAAIDRALAGTCTEDSSWTRTGSDVRWFEIGFGIAGATSLRLPESSQVALSLAPIFDTARADRLAAALPRARTLVLSVDGYEHAGRAWKKRHLVIELKSGVADADAVAALDWLADQPEALPRGPQALVGTLAIEGKTRPIAISLEYRTAHDRQLGSVVALGEIRRLADANSDTSDFK